MQSTHSGAAPAPADGAHRALLGRAPRLVFVVNADWFFLSHRLPLALAAQRAGFDVTVAAGDSGHAGEIRAAGLRFEPLAISRKGTRVREEAATLAALVRLYRRLRPDLVHHVTIKPVLYGSLAARVTGVPGVVNAISGLGHVFSGSTRIPFLQRGAEAGYRVALGGARTRTIFQNPEDRDAFVSRRLVRAEHTVLIRGSGVDCTRFTVLPEPDGTPMVLLASRMLWDKGVGEFAEAARRLRTRGVAGRFVLVGRADDETPTAVSRGQLEEWVREGVLEWWGQRSDMPEVMSQASIVALPTFYREGLPKVLLEAGAAGRPMVATDIPGCREIVRPGRNGFLIPPRDTDALVDALAELLASPALRRRLGAESRVVVEEEFTEQRVVEQTMELYGALLGASASGGRR